MPQPITTGGFQTTNLPQINWLDPRMMIPDYTRVLTGLDQGLDTVKNVGAIRDQALTRQAVEQEQAQKIAATNAINQYAGQQALANLSLLPQATNLSSAKSSAELSALPSKTQADIAKATLGGATDTAALANVAPAAQNTGKQLSLTGKGLDFQDTQLPVTQGTTANENAAVNVASQGDLATAQKKNKALEGALDNRISEQDLQKVKTQTDAINANLAQSLAQQKADFIKKNPSWNENDLQSAFLQSQQAHDALEGIRDATKNLPDFYKKKAEADYYATLANTARSQTEIANNGLTPADIARTGEMQLKAAEAQREQAKAKREALNTVGEVAAAPGQSVAQFAGNVADRTYDPETGKYEWKARDIFSTHPLGIPVNKERDLNVKRYNDLAQSVGQDSISIPSLLSGATASPLGTLRLAPPKPTPVPTPASPLLAPATRGLPGTQSAAPAPAPAIPTAAIARLRANPGLAQDFADAYHVDPRQYLQ